jgi:hypothetical protein
MINKTWPGDVGRCLDPCDAGTSEALLVPHDVGEGWTANWIGAIRNCGASLFAGMSGGSAADRDDGGSDREGVRSGLTSWEMVLSGEVGVQGEVGCVYTWWGWATRASSFPSACS